MRTRTSRLSSASPGSRRRYRPTKRSMKTLWVRVRRFTCCWHKGQRFAAAIADLMQSAQNTWEHSVDVGCVINDRLRGGERGKV